MFKPFLIEQLEMEEFLDRHFPRGTPAAPGESPTEALERELKEFAADPKVLKFLEDSTFEGEYRWRFAQDAGLSEPTFRKL